ncbi:MAG: aminotransferase class IV, partial [Myxococcota bacterium]
TILPGITRDSVITLLRDKGMTVSERKLPIQEVLDAHTNRTLKEVFGTGTAAIIASVGELGFADGDRVIGEGTVGPLARQLFDEIVAIQRGTAEDRFGWTDLLETDH